MCGFSFFQLFDKKLMNHVNSIFFFFFSSESLLRRALFEETGGMYPELITRNDVKVFLPPIGGQTVYICTRYFFPTLFTFFFFFYKFFFQSRKSCLHV